MKGTDWTCPECGKKVRKSDDRALLPATERYPGHVWHLACYESLPGGMGRQAQPLATKGRESGATNHAARNLPYRGGPKGGVVPAVERAEPEVSAREAAVNPPGQAIVRLTDVGRAVLREGRRRSAKEPIP